MPRQKEIDPVKRYSELIRFLETPLTEENYQTLSREAAANGPTDLGCHGLGFGARFTLDRARAIQRSMKAKLDRFANLEDPSPILLDITTALKLRFLELLREASIPKTQLTKMKTGFTPVIRRVREIRLCPYCGRYFGRRKRMRVYTCGRQACIRQRDKEVRCLRTDAQ